MKKQMLVAGLSMALLPTVVATPIFAAEVPAQPKTEVNTEVKDTTKEATNAVKPEVKAPEATTQKTELGYSYLQKNNLLENITAKEDAPFTRAMAATLLANMEKPQLTKDNKFSDVKEDNVVAQQINWAASKNIMVGYGNGIFAPDKQMTRQELASVLYRYILNYKNFKPATLSGLKTPFKDKDKLSSWALDEAITMCGMGIMDPKDGNFDPQGLVTVADAAKAFASAHDLFDNGTDVKNTEAAGKAEDKEVQKAVDKDTKSEGKTPEAKKDDVKKDDNKKADDQTSKDHTTSDQKTDEGKTPQTK